MNPDYEQIKYLDQYGKYEVVYQTLGWIQIGSEDHGYYGEHESPLLGAYYQPAKTGCEGRQRGDYNKRPDAEAIVELKITWSRSGENSRM